MCLLIPIPKLSKYKKKLGVSLTAANRKCWDLARGEKPAIKKQHNNIQPYRRKAADFWLALRFMVMIGVWRHYKIIGNLLCIAASSVNIPGEITLGELTEGSMMGCINRVKEEKKSLSFTTTYWQCIAELDISQSFILNSPGSCECREDLMGFTSLLMSLHSPSTRGVQGAALVLLSRQPHTVAQPGCPFVCPTAPVHLLLFVWYFQIPKFFAEWKRLHYRSWRSIPICCLCPIIWTVCLHLLLEVTHIWRAFAPAWSWLTTETTHV